MSHQIGDALIQKYIQSFDHAPQQMGSRLAGAVRQEDFNAENAFVDRIGAVAAQEITTRHADTVYQDTPHTRRKLPLRSWSVADLRDEEDLKRMLNDPASEYAKAQRNALGRAMDDAIIEAAFGTAYAGKTGTSPISAGWLTGGTAGAKLTVALFVDAKNKLLKQEALDPDEEVFFACSSDVITDLMETTQATSSDFIAVQPLWSGVVNYLYGVTIIRTERLLKANAGADWRNIMFARSGLCLARSGGVEVNVDRLPTKNQSLQIQTKAHFAAVRLWEEKVIEVLSDVR